MGWRDSSCAKYGDGSWSQSATAGWPGLQPPEYSVRRRRRPERLDRGDCNTSFHAVQCRIGALNLAEHRSWLLNIIAFILLTCAPAVPAQVHQSGHPGITAKGLEAPAAGGAAHTEDATMRPSGGSGDQVVPGGGNSSGFTSSNARPATGGAALQQGAAGTRDAGQVALPTFSRHCRPQCQACVNRISNSLLRLAIDLPPVKFRRQAVGRQQQRCGQPGIVHQRRRHSRRILLNRTCAAVLEWRNASPQLSAPRRRAHSGSNSSSASDSTARCQPQSGGTPPPAADLPGVAIMG